MPVMQVYRMNAASMQFCQMSEVTSKWGASACHICRLHYLVLQRAGFRCLRNPVWHPPVPVARHASSSNDTAHRQSCDSQYILDQVKMHYLAAICICTGLDCPCSCARLGLLQNTAAMLARRAHAKHRVHTSAHLHMAIHLPTYK